MAFKMFSETVHTRIRVYCSFYFLNLFNALVPYAGGYSGQDTAERSLWSRRSVHHQLSAVCSWPLSLQRRLLRPSRRLR